MWVVDPADTDFGYSNVPDSTAPEYSATTTYALDYVVKVTTHNQPTHTYKSLIGGNLGNSPATAIDCWQDLGVTNRWLMFDTSSTSQTVSDMAIVTELSAANIDSIVLLGLVAESVRVEHLYGGQVINDQTYSLAEVSEADISDWYEYFFAGIAMRSTLVAYVDKRSYSTVRLTIKPMGDTAACAVEDVGGKTEVGTTKREIQLNFVDYSKKDTNEFGNSYLAPGAWANKVVCSAYFDSATINAMAKLRAKLRAKAALWNCDNIDLGYEPLLIFGFFQTFDIVIPDDAISLCNFEIMGLT